MSEKFWLEGPIPEPTQAPAPTLKQIYDDLGTRTDVAKALDVLHWRVNRWIERRDEINSPQPIKRFGHIDVYSIAEWKSWYGQWLARFEPDRWINTMRNGQGESFFTYWR